MSYVAETFKENGYTVEIVQDDDSESPREWDNLGVMFTSHRNYTLGDPDVEEYTRAADHFYERATSRAAFARMFTLYVKTYHGATVVLPVGLHDHSGISVYVGSEPSAFDPGGWDSGQVGWIFDTAGTREACELTNFTIEQTAASLTGEVETYNQYLTGDIYGYRVLDTEGDDVESCWGFYGTESAIEEGRSVAAALEPTTILDGLAKRRESLVESLASLDQEIASQS